MAITTQFLTGFEHGFIGTAASAGGGLFDTVTAGVTASTTTPRNGAYCCHVVAPASTITRITKTIASQTKLVVRFGVKVTAIPASGTAKIMHSQGFTISISSAGVLSAQLATTGTAQTGPTIDTTNWYLIELQGDTAAGTLDWKVDGAAQTRATGTGAAVTTVGLGTDLATQPAFTADFDDWIVGTWTVAASDWYGNGKVIVQLPGLDYNHLGTVNMFSHGDAGTLYAAAPTNAYTMVDDAPGTGGWTATRSTTDNIAMRAVNASSYVSMKAAPTAETGTPNAVRALMSYSSPATGANLAACDARTFSATPVELWGLTNGTGKAYNVTANTFKGAVITPPASGWNASALNNAEVRFGGCTSADINPVPTLQAWMFEVDWPVSVPTGTPWTAAPGDTITVGDSIALEIGKIVALTEPLTVADAYAGVATFDRAMPDTVTVTDLLSPVGAFARAVTDTVTVADVATPELGVGGVGHTRTVPDTMTLADLAALARGVAQTVGDPLAIADASLRDVTKPLSDTVAMTDQVVQSATLQRALADTLTVADQATALAIIDRALADTLTVVDQQQLQAATARLVADTLTVIDQARADVGKALADTLAITDQAVPLVILDRQLADTLTATDTTITATARFATLADTLTGADQQTFLRTGFLAFPDALAIADQATPFVVAGAQHQVPLADLLTLADSLARTVTYTRVLADTVAMADQPATLNATLRAFPELLTVTDQASTVTGGGLPRFLPLADLLAITDASSRSLIHARTLTDPVTVTEALTQRWDRWLTPADTLLITDLLIPVYAIRWFGITVSDWPVVRAVLNHDPLSVLLLDDDPVSVAVMGASKVTGARVGHWPLTIISVRARRK